MTDNRPILAKNKTTGEHYTTTRHLAKKRGDEVLEGRPATDVHGRWLPPKPVKNVQPTRTTIRKPVKGEEEA